MKSIQTVKQRIHGHVSSFYDLSRGTGVTTITNPHIIREKKRQKDTGAAVDLSVSYED